MKSSFTFFHFILFFLIFGFTQSAFSQSKKERKSSKKEIKKRIPHAHGFYGTDPSYLRVSAVKTITGPRARIESFDIGFKFNFKVNHTQIDTILEYDEELGIDQKVPKKVNGTSSQFFSIISGETSVFDTSSTVPANAFVSINSYFINKKNKSTAFASGELERIPFGGVSTKVFGGKFYAGGHLGSVEVAGLYKNSYWMGGLYLPISKNDNLEFSRDDFKAYVFMEGSVGISKDVRFKMVEEGGNGVNKTLTYMNNVLQSLRFKFEVLQPIGSGLVLNDTKVRFSLAIPIVALIQ